MKIIILLVCLAMVCELGRARSSSLNEEWIRYKKQYRKVYQTPEEEARRFSLFLASKAKIERHNANEQVSYRLGLNQMSDWSPDERATLYGLNYDPIEHEMRVEASKEHPLVRKIHADTSRLPVEFDWRKVPNVVSPVGYQGNCGSSYAFATTGVLEGQQVVMNFTKELVPLSVQEIVDCTIHNGGCGGGSMSKAMDDLVSDYGGILSDKDYPYVANMSTGCSVNKKSKSVMSFYYASELLFDLRLFKRFVAKYGPLAVGLATSENFQHYKSGIFTDTTCGDQPDLAVLIVGYGVDPKIGKYWIIKNSFSTDWGEEGYMRIKHGICQLGLFAAAPSFLE